MQESASGYKVREAHDRDLAALPGIERAAAQLFLETDHPDIARENPDSVESFRAWRALGMVLVAVDRRDLPVGFAVVVVCGADAYLQELDVHPDHGRRGVGRMLVDSVRSWAAARGRVRVVLSTFVDVPWNAPFYRRLGFRELCEAELGDGLREIRRKEAAAGLDVARRVLMVLPIGQAPR